MKKNTFNIVYINHDGELKHESYITKLTDPNDVRAVFATVGVTLMECELKPEN